MVNLIGFIYIVHFLHFPILVPVNVYHAGFDDANSLLDEHRLNQVKEQDQENLR